MMSRFYRPVVGFTVPGMQLAALTLAILAATGCSVQAPDETATASADDVELALASEVEEERRAATVNNIVASARFDPATGGIVLAGQLPARATVQVFSGATNLSLGTVNAVSPFAISSDDNSISAQGLAPWQLVVPATAFTTVPCTIRLQTPQGSVLVPVQAPVSAGQTLNCATGVTGQAQAQTQALTVSRATWNAQTGSLIVAGTGALPRQTVTFLDAQTSAVIGVDTANATGAFRLRLPNVAAPACNVQVVADTRQVTSAVTGAPAACLTAQSSTNLAPNTVITAPATDSTVVLELDSAGKFVPRMVSFDMVGIDPDNNIPLTYLWNFDGAAPNSIEKNPSVYFSRPGVYRVSATVTDALGAVDATPAVRTVIVQPPQTGSVGGSALAPNGQILSPAANTSIVAGGSVNFAATGTSLGGLSLTYIWNFGGAAANVATQNPGNVIFTKPGTYTVTMTAVDSLGYSDPTPEERVITVAAVGAAGTNLSPNGEITAPVNATTTVKAGQSVMFTATGADPDANLPMTYLWDFSGQAPVAAQQTANVVFNQVGTYKVTLFTFDSLGAVDPTPAVRTIVVEPGTGQATPNGLYPESTINSPAADVTISVGESVSFTGTGSDATTGSALIYAWDFDGGATNTTVQNPGAVFFGKAGSYRVRLAARNTAGRVDPSPAERIVTVTDPVSSNRAPNGQIVFPVGNQTIQVGQTIDFAGSATDQDGGTTFHYEWDFGTAAPMTLVQNAGVITFKQAGTYRVALRVKDTLEMADPTPDVRIITVTNTGNVNEAPNSIITSPAMDLTVNTGDSVSFMGTGIDAESGALKYQWTFNGATAASTIVANPGSVTFNQPGTYQISLVATDGQGLADPTPDVRTITVRDISNSNPAPDGQIATPTAVTTTVTAGQSINFTGSATDNGAVTGLLYHWDFDGAAVDSAAKDPGSVTFARPGSYKIALRVTDDRGAVDLSPATRNVIVLPASGSISAVAPEGSIVTPSNNVTIGLGQSLSFRANATDADSNIPLSYRWNFDGAAPESNAQDPGYVAFTKPGIYQVAMTVTDSTGVSDASPEIRTVTVLGSGNTTSSTSAPNAVISSPATNQTIVAGGSVNFAGSASDTSGTSLSYAWNFGASGLGSRSQQSPGQLTFNTAGTYKVTLGVSNGLGLSDATPDERIITVLSADSTTSALKPDGAITTPVVDLIIKAGEAVHFMGQVVTATANQPMRYVWNFDGGALTRTERGPGDVTFNTPGVYAVMFTVIDSQNVADPTPSMRTITVVPK